MSSEKDRERLKKEADLLTNEEFVIDTQTLFQIEEERRKHAKEQAQMLKSFLSIKEGRQFLTVLGEGEPHQLMDIKSTSNFTEKVTDLSLENSKLPTTLSTLHEEGGEETVQNNDSIISIVNSNTKHLRANSLPIGLEFASNQASSSSSISIPSRHDFSVAPKYSVSISNNPTGSRDGFITVEQLDLNVTCREILDIYFDRQSIPGVNRQLYHLYVLKNGYEQQRLEYEDKPIVIQNQWLQDFGFHPSEPEFASLGRLDFGFYFRFFVARSLPSHHSPLDLAVSADSVEGYLSIDLAGKNLFKIPNRFYSFASQISTLNLTQNRMFNLSIEFCKSCTNLSKFIAAYNSIDKFPFGIIYFAGTLTWLDLGMNYLREDSMDLLSRLINLRVLMLNCNRLKSLPTSFGQLRNLRILNLSNNFMQTIPECFFELQELVHLDMSYNLINTLPTQIGCLSKLQVLNLENNLIKTLPEEMQSLHHLKRLTMTYNLIDNIENFSHIPSLSKLTLDHTRIKEATITNSQLEYISICDSHLSKITLSSKFSNLTILLLDYCKISVLPEDFFIACPFLKYLSMKNNLLVSFPSSFETLEQIEYVDLSNNQLDSIAISANFSRLHSLLLNNNNLKTLPCTVWMLKRLCKLSLSSNTIYTLPHSNDPIVSLEELYLQENLLNNSICLLFGKLSSIKVFNLSFNPKISQLHDIHLLTSLTHLYLSGIGLPNVPAGIGALHKLQALHLDMNQIISVPSELSGCSRLRLLDLACNRLKYNINNYPYDWNWTLNPSLEYLDLSGNADFWIQRIVPDENPFASMPNLKHVNLNGITKIDCDDKRLAIDSRNNFAFETYVNFNEHGLIDYAFSQLNCTDNSKTDVRLSTDSRGASCSYARDSAKTAHLAPNSTHTVSAKGKSPSTSCLPSFGVAQLPFGQAYTAQISTGSGFANEADFHVALFDGAPEVVSFLAGTFDSVLTAQLDALKMHPLVQSTEYSPSIDKSGENISDLGFSIDVPLAIRKTFLECNRRLCIKLTSEPTQHPPTYSSSKRSKSVQNTNHLALHDQLDHIDSDLLSVIAPVSALCKAKSHLKTSASGIFVARKGDIIYCANVGSCKAVLSRSGRAISISSWDSIKNPQELWRLRHIGGNIDRFGCVNGITKVAKQLGDPTNIPFICGCPSIYDIQIDNTNDEFIIVASKGLWNVLSNQLAVDLVRRERTNLQVAARKLRDFAYGYGKIRESLDVCIIGLRDLGISSLAPSDQLALASGKAIRTPSAYALDSPLMDVSLARLDTEISPPIGDVTLVFTDIKGSTTLWSHADKAMKQALRIHNRIMRRLLRTIGGYEVKTEGDAFMVAFCNPKQAIKWCMLVQTELLAADWPSEIFNVQETKQFVEQEMPSSSPLYRGLSVRMGVHVGQPVCELDPVTLRMDYFGLEVTIAARIRDLADGGQLFATQPIYDAICQLREPADLKQLLEPVFVPLGNKHLKGIKNELPVYAVYPRQLQDRHGYHAQLEQASEQPTNDSFLAIDDSLFATLLQHFSSLATALGLPAVIVTPSGSNVPLVEVKNSNESLLRLLENFERLASYFRLTDEGRLVDLFAKYDNQFQFSKNPQLFSRFLEELNRAKYFPDQRLN